MGVSKSFGTHITGIPPRQHVRIVHWSGIGSNGPKIPILGQIWPFCMPKIHFLGGMEKILVMAGKLHIKPLDSISLRSGLRRLFCCNLAIPITVSLHNWTVSCLGFIECCRTRVILSCYLVLWPLLRWLCLNCWCILRAHLSCPFRLHRLAGTVSTEA